MATNYWKMLKIIGKIRDPLLTHSTVIKMDAGEPVVIIEDSLIVSLFLIVLF